MKIIMIYIYCSKIIVTIMMVFYQITMVTIMISIYQITMVTVQMVFYFYQDNHIELVME
jgi:hypothetical protein